MVWELGAAGGGVGALMLGLLIKRFINSVDKAQTREECSRIHAVVTRELTEIKESLRDSRREHREDMQRIFERMGK